MIFPEIDPRTKMLIVLCLSSLGVLTTDSGTLGLILLASVIIALSFGAQMMQIIHKLKKLLFIIFMIAIVQSVFMPSGEILIGFGQIALLTVGGLERTLEFILRMLIIISSAAILTTSNQREIIQGLIQLKLPYELAFMSSMGIHFLPMLAESFTDAITAIQLRGIDISRIGIKDKVDTYLYILNPVITSAILKSHRIAMSIELRGFRAFPQRTSILVLKLKARDYSLIAAILLFSGIIVFR